LHTDDPFVSTIIIFENLIDIENKKLKRIPRRATTNNDRCNKYD
jgi:hypothetical protein